MDIKEAIDLLREDTEIKTMVSKKGVRTEIHGDKLGAMLGAAAILSNIVEGEEMDETDTDLETVVQWTRVLLTKLIRYQ